MIPIVSPPSWINTFVGCLELSYHQTRHMARYATGLIASRNKTVADISSLFINAPSSKAMNLFMKEYDWDGREINTKRISELQNHNETAWNRNGICILDDTIIEKSGKHIPGVGKFFDHAKDRFVTGHNLVTLHYADKKTTYPIDFRLYLKEDATEEEEFKTKIEFAKELIRYDVNIGSPVMTYVFDAWYTCNQLTAFVESLERFWIGRCKCDLLVRVDGGKFIRLDEYESSLPKEKFMSLNISGKKLRVFTKTVYLKSLERRVRLVISRKGKDVLYLATNRKDHATRILTAYMWRSKIEQFYKDAKQHLGLGRYQFRDLDAIKRHWYIVFLTHSLLRLSASESMLGKLVLASSIGKSSRKVCLELIEQLMYFAIEGGKDVNEIMEFMSKRI